MTTHMHAPVDGIRAVAAIRRSQALLVAISGIDGSGKSTLARRLGARLQGAGLRVACIGVDPWQNPQSVRLGGPDPGVHFYRHAVRFDAMLEQLVLPLVRTRRVDLHVAGMRTDRDLVEPIHYCYADVDVVLLEGIFLLQPRFDDFYDLRLWVECSFDTALRRALQRNAEGKTQDALREDYATIYHAAQRHHLAVDDPRGRADFTVNNDRDACRSGTVS
ncbi:MAG TPA: hypothetical protein VF277_08770 [Steroidobacteraceae bacterium]